MGAEMLSCLWWLAETEGWPIEEGELHESAPGESWERAWRSDR